MADVKFSEFVAGGALQNNDILVGLRSGLNYKFTYSNVAGGSLTGTYPNPTIANLAVTNAMIANSTIDLTTKVTGTLPVLNGGTGQSSYTNGQLLIGNTTGNTLTKASLTAGTGISITPGAGSITIAATGDQSVTLQDAYDNGTGAITTINAKPFKITSFTSNVSSSPIIQSTGNTFSLLACTDAAADQKIWAWRASSAGELSGVLYNDSFGAPSPWIEVNRSGATPAIINFLGTSLQFNGDAIAKVNQIVVTSWDGSSTPVAVTAGAGIDITSGTITATGTPSTVVSFGEMFIGPANTLPTTLNGSGQWTKVEAGPGPSPDYSFWNSGEVSGFSFSNGTLTCTASASQRYNVSIAGSGFFATGGGNVATQIFTCVFANGNTTVTGSSLNAVTFGTGTSTDGAVTFAMEGIFTLGNGDYLELFVKNSVNAQNPIFKFATFVIEPLSTAGSAIDFSWQTITASQSIASNTGYLTNSAGMLTLTLPIVFVAGEIFAVSGVGSGGWHITQQANQQIITENGSTTVGVGGSLESGAGSPKDGVTMVAIDTLTLKVINSEGSSIIVV